MCFSYTCIYVVLLPMHFIFVSFFKSANYPKTFVSYYHLNDLTIFLHYQIQVFSVNAGILASGFKNAFSVLNVHGLMAFQNQCQKSSLIFGTRKLAVFMAPTSLVDLIASFCVVRTVGNSFFTVFRCMCFRIRLIFEMCKFARKSAKTLISLTF